MKLATVLLTATVIALATHSSIAQGRDNVDGVRRVQVVTSESEPASVKLRNLINPAASPARNADEPQPTDGKDDSQVASTTSLAQASATPSTVTEKQGSRPSSTRSTAASQATATHQSSASNAASVVAGRALIGWTMAVVAGAAIPWLN
ncbi:hypothetical protein H4R35_001066 [Dimargaris xerosporica]|nr:hypothetical protein H4R35_001066 [Dimargaris xerosporica]